MSKRSTALRQAQGSRRGVAATASAAGVARPRGHASYLPSAEDPTPNAPLMLDQPVDTLPVVADFRWNRFASQWAPAAIVLWWLVLSLFGWFAWPLMFPIARGLRDRGYGLSRAAGWLLVGWVHWLGVSLGLWQNRVGPMLAVLGVLALLGLIAWRVQRREIAAFRAEHGATMWAGELLFAGAYLAFVGIRVLNPDLWQPWNGGEKFMEFAFLNATLRSAHFPPFDPYFAGGTINYYYFGLYLVSVPIKLTGIVPEVAFNLAVPGLFALTALGLFSVGHSLAARADRARRGGLLAVFLALLLGNLAGFRELLNTMTRNGGGSRLAAMVRGLGQMLTGAASAGYSFWSPSRVIPYTINEFPYWTFLFADLHPHMIAMPFGMLVIGLALNWMLEGGHWGVGIGEQEPRAWLRRWAGLILMALAVGAMGAINTWDLPTYFLLVVGALVVSTWGEGRSAAVIGALASAGLLLVLAVAAYEPFYAHYQAQVGGDGGLIGRYLGFTPDGSPLGPWLLIWGVFIYLAFSYLLVELWQRRPAIQRQAAGELVAAPSLLSPDASPTYDSPTTGEPVQHAFRWRLFGMLGLAALFTLLAVLGRGTVALAAIPLVLALAFAFRRWSAPNAAFVNLLLALGMGVLAGTEVIYLRDFLQGSDWYRMNTLFKFSVPAWLCLGLAGSVMLPRVWDAAARRPVWVRVPWQVVMSSLLIAGFVFLPLGTMDRVMDRFPGPRPALGTLDGTAFMTVGRYQWPDAEHTIELAYDYLAIHWLLDNVAGSPVIAEAPAGSYQVNGKDVGYDYYRAGGLRVASLTGFPTFVGHHQYEQRPGDQVGRRTELGREFFRTTDVARTRVLIRELRVGYIYIGQLERILFDAASLDKFEAMVAAGDLQIVYRNPQVTIYRVIAGPV